VVAKRTPVEGSAPSLAVPKAKRADHPPSWRTWDLVGTTALGAMLSGLPQPIHS
jgi:hypothetical protein